MPQPIWIVIPCFNEAARLPVDQFAGFAESHPQIHFLLVNDGSQDGTGAVLENLCQRLGDQGQTLTLVSNQGKAEAVRRGLKHLADQFGQDQILMGYWDADLATPLEEIPRMAAVFTEQPEVSLVMGARVKLLGRSVLRNPWRHYLGRVFATAAANVLGFAVYDTQCGAKMMRLTQEISEILKAPFASRWVFDVELIARLRQLLATKGKLKPDQFIYELPLMQWHDIKGSKVKPWDFFVALVDLFQIYRRYQVKS